MLVFNNSQAPSRLKDRDGNPLMWRITVRQNRTYSVEMSDFALQNYLDSGTLITTLNDAIMACTKAERKIEISHLGKPFPCYATSERDKTVKLTRPAQDLLAQFCTIARRVKDNWDRKDEEPNYAEFGVEIAQLIIENNLTAQDFDQMYDSLHRTGENA